MRSPALHFWLALACLLAVVYASFGYWRAHRDEAHLASAAHAAPSDASNHAAPIVPNHEPLTEFTLTDSSGQPFNSESLRGKVWVASFFFVNCPQMCWKQNQALAAVQQTTPESEAQFISISCDPDNDTPEALAKYAEHFHADPARWKFLTGDLGLICRIGKDFFRISVEKAGHTDRACVVDRNGQVRGSFRMTEPGQLEMLKKILAVVEAEPVTAASDQASPAREETAPADAAVSPAAASADPAPSKEG